MAMSVESLRENLLESCVPEPNTGCWLWLRGEGNFGYGRVRVAKKSEYAHRASFLAFKGEIPEGLSVLHSCDTAACINPGHLRLGTQKDNMADASRRGRVAGRRSRFTQEQLDEMKRRVLAGEDSRVLSREYGLGEGYFWRMRRGWCPENVRKE